MGELQSIADLISEKDVYERFPHIFADKELRDARQSGDLDYYSLRKGIFYTETMLIKYLEKRHKKSCQNRPLAPEASDNKAESGSSATNGLGRKKVRLISTDIGTQSAPTPNESEDELIARALERAT